MAGGNGYPSGTDRAFLRDFVAQQHRSLHGDGAGAGQGSDGAGSNHATFEVCAHRGEVVQIDVATLECCENLLNVGGVRSGEKATVEFRTEDCGFVGGSNDARGRVAEGFKGLGGA